MTRVVVTQNDVDRAIRIADWYRRRTPRASVADLHGAALEGLAHAVDRYDGSGGAKRFWEFAFKRILGAMRDELRQDDHLTRNQRKDLEGLAREMPWLNPDEPVPLDARMQMPDEEGGTVGELIADPRDAYAQAETIDALRRVFFDVPLRERRAFFAVDFLGIPNNDVAAQLGVSPGRVTQLRAAAAKLARESLGPEFLQAA